VVDTSRSDERLSSSDGHFVVGVGASAGGLEALTLLLRHLPPKSGLAFVLVLMLGNLRGIRESGLIFTLDTLEYLARGGRIGRAAGWAGQLLHIKPILTLSEGEVLPLKRVRGNRKAIQEFASAFRSGTRDEPGLRVGIAHADAPDRMEAVEKLVRDIRPSADIEVATTLGPVVGTHAGPGTVGLFWLQD